MRHCTSQFWTHETFNLSLSIARNRVETMNRTRGRHRHDKGSKNTHKWTNRTKTEQVTTTKEEGDSVVRKPHSKGTAQHSEPPRNVRNNTNQLECQVPVNQRVEKFEMAAVPIASNTKNNSE